MSKRAEEKAREYENSLDYYHYTSDNPSVAYKAGYEQALSDIKNLIDSNIMPAYAGKIIRLIEQNYE
jgi:hypothetical protein